MGRTACTEPQCLYKDALFFILTNRINISFSKGLPFIQLAGHITVTIFLAILVIFK